MRQARPTLSEITTASRTPVAACSAARRARALASGSSGHSKTAGSSPQPTLEASMPALASTWPVRWRVMITPGATRISSWASRGDQLDHGRVLVGPRGGVARLGAGGDAGQPHGAALDLGDHLLGDHDDVAVPQRLAGDCHGADDGGGQVVAWRGRGAGRPGRAPRAMPRAGASLGRPVIFTPAWTIL
jgi:hypothetical protein